MLFVDTETVSMLYVVNAEVENRVLTLGLIQSMLVELRILSGKLFQTESLKPRAARTVSATLTDVSMRIVEYGLVHSLKFTQRDWLTSRLYIVRQCCQFEECTMDRIYSWKQM